MKTNKLVLISCIIFCITLLLSSKALASTVTYRIAGSDRYETAVKASKDGWQKSENVVLATGDNFPDALCAAPLAKQLNAPILLTGQLYLNASTESELIRLGAKNITIIGGSGVISDNVKNYLETKGYKCTRLYGNDRYETSEAVAKYLSTNFRIGDELVVATGEDYADALSISPIAAQKSMPIILVPKDNLPDSIKTYISVRGFNKTYAIGDSTIISNDVIQSFPNVERISGSTKYERNISILTKFAGYYNLNTILIATGEDFPDALAGSALSQKTSSPLILTQKFPAQISRDFISTKLPQLNNIKVLGGEGVIPQNTIQTLLTKNNLNIKVHFIDVGQGDCILIQTPAGKNVLIDAGSESTENKVVSYLKAQGIKTIDALVGTHIHEDHIGGMDGVIKNFGINKVYMPNVKSLDSSYRNIIESLYSKNISITSPTAGTYIDLDSDVYLQILAPKKDTTYDKVDDYSIVLKLGYYGNRFMLTGDAGQVSEDEMIEKRYNLNADVLKIGNHGNDTSTSLSFLNGVKPKYAIISVGTGNKDGLPEFSILNSLATQGIKVFRTDYDGTIVCTGDGKDLWFNTFKQTN